MDGTRPATDTAACGRSPACGPVPLGECRRDFLGTPIDCLSLAQTVAAAEEAMRQRRLLHHVCLNVAKFVAMRSNSELDDDVRSSDIVSADGAGIVWAARLFGVPVPERVAGIDLFMALMERCAEAGYRPYFLGAEHEVLAAALRRLRADFPALTLAGWRDGYFSAAEEAAVVETIRQSGADCLFIGMPTPRKERFLHRHRDRLGVAFVMGVGGSFDVVAGKTRRAPKAVQTIGMEWAWRLAQEPRRLGPRYLRSNLAFAAILARSLCAGRQAQPTRPPGQRPETGNRSLDAPN